MYGGSLARDFSPCLPCQRHLLQRGEPDGQFAQVGKPAHATVLRNAVAPPCLPCLPYPLCPLLARCFIVTNYCVGNLGCVAEYCPTKAEISGLYSRK